MQTQLLSALIAALSFAILDSMRAGSATWNLDPISDDWNTAANWTPQMVPNGPEDVATFANSNIMTISLSDNTEVDRIVFNPGADLFSISVDSFLVLTLSGGGIINQSGVSQHFLLSPNAAQMRFSNDASAGTKTHFRLGATTAFESTRIQFFDRSSADHGTFITEGGKREFAFGARTEFHGESSGGDGAFINEPGENDGSTGAVVFYDNATAANGTFSNLAGGTVPFGGAFTLFLNDSSAGQGSFLNQGAPQGGDFGQTVFRDTSTAAEAVLTCEAGTVHGAPGGSVSFEGSSSAAAATLIANGGPGDGGEILFLDTSDGGAARVEVFGNGSLDVASHNPPGLTIGSLEGEGLAFLGANSLSIGSNDLSTTFSGLIQGTGSVVKLGTGTLSLSGANTYTGGTIVSSGILLAKNVTGSGTGTGAVSINAGTLGGSGIIAGAVTIGMNTGVRAFLAPSKGAKEPATLTILGALRFNDDSSYRCHLDTEKATADEVIANDVMIESEARFSLRPSGNNAVTEGQIFTVISNTSASPIVGTFGNLPEGKIVVINGSQLQASYNGGDGNELTLTVLP